jgi:acyl-CoA synthetase (AMP-forming)/AMP-acid ligase II
VCARSNVVFAGHWKQPEETDAAIRDGWFHTGDLGVLDDERYLSIVGRLKEIIRTGGESVAPSEVEAALADHPAIDEIAVVGMPDARWGEVVCAVVVARGAAPGLEALQRHCEGRLAGFKKPRRLELVDALPRTAATGQVQRTLIVQQLEARTTGGS